MSLTQKIYGLVLVLSGTGVALTMIPFYASAQIEMETHVFEEALTPKEFDTERISDLAERYIEGTITESELTELIDAVEDTSYLDAFRAQRLGEEVPLDVDAPMMADETMSDNETLLDSNESETTIIDSSNPEEVADISASSVPPQSNPLLWLLVAAVLINFVLCLFILVSLGRKKSNSGNQSVPPQY